MLDLWYGYCTIDTTTAHYKNCGWLYPTKVAPSNTSTVVLGNVTWNALDLYNAEYAQSNEGIIAVMWVCMAVSIAGLLITLAFVKESKNSTLEEVDKSSVVLNRHYAEVKAAEDHNTSVRELGKQSPPVDAVVAEKSAVAAEDPAPKSV